MDYGNNGSEFNWSYMGGVGGSQGAQCGGGQQNMPVYPHMSQMNAGWGNGGHGGDASRQWLHSNQANSFGQSMAQNSSPPAEYEAYNQSMMRSYASMPKSGGDEMGHNMAMSHMGGGGNNYASYGGRMSHNGLGGAMGHGGHHMGHSSW